MTIHKFDLETVHVKVLLLALQHLQVTPDSCPQNGHVGFSESEMDAYEKLKAVFEIAVDIDKLDLDTFDGSSIKNDMLRAAKEFLKKM